MHLVFVYADHGIMSYTITMGNMIGMRRRLRPSRPSIRVIMPNMQTAARMSVTIDVSIIRTRLPHPMRRPTQVRTVEIR